MKHLTRQATCLLLCLAILLGIAPVFTLSAAAASIGDRNDQSLGYTLDTSDYISLPIEINDYYNDGMLFEFASPTSTYTSYYYSGVPTVNIGWDFTSSSSLTQIKALQNTMGHNGIKMNSTFTLTQTKYDTDDNTLFTASPLCARRSSTTGSGWSAGNATKGTNIENELLTLGNLGGVKKENARYMAIGYLASYESHRNDDGLYVFARTNATDAPIPLTSQKTDKNFLFDNTWHNAVLDLAENTANWNSLTTLNYISINPINATTSSRNPRFYICYAAFFATKAEAEAFVQTVNTTRGKYQINSNHGFGLVGASKNADGTVRVSSVHSVSDSDGIKWIGESTDRGMTLPLKLNTLSTLSGSLQSTLTMGQCVIGLVNPTLSENGLPTYHDNTVTYVANHLKEALETPATDSSTGLKNYNYVSGTASSLFGGTDLATALRTQIKKGGNKLGSLAETQKKASKLIGSFATCKGNIATYYDAAYYLLNNLFVQNAYSESDSTFTHLRLSKATIDGQECYVFDGGFADTSGKSTTVYDTKSGVIYNTAASTKKAYSYYDKTGLTTTYPFLPLVNKNNAAGQTNIPYFKDDGARNGAGVFNTYANRDYNFTMKGSGQFVYSESDDLFFEFQGDDDVYLFINGQLVLDCGGAHPVASQNFKLNDYVKAAKAKLAAGSTDAYDIGLALEDGETYSFDFFYMERKGYGANLRITTNIKITDTSISGDKDAIQEDTVLPSGSNIDFDLPVEFAFHLTNNGTDNIDQTGTAGIQDSALLNLSFADSKLGVTIDYKKGLTINGTNVINADGKTLTASDLTLILKDANGNVIATHKPKDNAALMTYLKTPNNTGVQSGCTLTIRGIYKKLTKADFGTSRTYTNTVDITCVSDAGKELHTQGTAKLRNVASLTYYTWAGHQVVVSSDKLKSDLASKQSELADLFADESGKSINPANITITKLEYVNSVGVPESSDYLSVNNSDKSLKLNYPVGSSQEYVRITYTYSGKTYSAIVPIAVYTVDVKDQVLVLDYALSCKLTENYVLEQEDHLEVAGQSTRWYRESTIADKEPTYVNNGLRENPTTTPSNSGMTVYNGDVTFTPPADIMANPRPFSTYMLYRVYDVSQSPSPAYTTDISKEVEMYKKVTVIPANVVYYEDDFPAITYYNLNDDGTATNVNTNGNTIKIVGKGKWTDMKQSNDQDSPYGSDDVYANSTTVTNTGGYFTSIVITHPSAIDRPDASFTFAGTGFELIGLTNAASSATVILQVVNESGEQVALIPVITEYDNGGDDGIDSVYSVPIAKVDGLNYGKYTVHIVGVAAYEYDSDGQRIPDGNGGYKIRATTVYIDGIRIYNPLGTSTSDTTNYSYTQYYNSGEKDAQFVELRDLLAGQQAAIVTATTKQDGTESGGLAFYTGNYSYVENRNGVSYSGQTYTGNIAGSVEDYVLMGPNNELYLSGSCEKSQAIAFYVAEDGTGAHSLQVALRLLSDGKFSGTSNTTTTAGVYLGVKSGVGNLFVWQELDQVVTSGTEQYYEINYKNCPTDTRNGKTYYQVVLRVGCLCTGANANKHTGMISFSSLKYKGLTIRENYGTASTVRFNELGLMEQLKDGDWTTITPLPDDDGKAVGVLRMDLIAEHMRSVTVAQPEEVLPYEIWEVTATEPQPTEPEPTEPEATEPGATDPILPPEKDGIIAESDGLYYYVDGNLQYCAGLVQIGEDYYYIRSNGQCAVGQYWITNTNGLLPAGLYTFGADGKMDRSGSTQKNGIVAENGGLYYYANNNIQYGAGLVQLNGDYYYIRSSGQCAIGVYWITVTNGLLPAGFYTFGVDGKMVAAASAKDGIVQEDGSYYYYQNGEIQYCAGLIRVNGDYYYVRSSGQCAIGTYWVTTTNGLLPAGFYTFGTDGKLMENVIEGGN